MKLIALSLILLSMGWGTSLIPVQLPDLYCFRLVKDINLNGSSVDDENSLPNEVAVFKGALYFGASRGIVNGFVTGEQLWKTDGTAAGTVLVKTIYPGGKANPDQFTIVGETLYFVATNPTSGREIWKTDGTAAGTVLVKDINPGAQEFAPPRYLRDVNGTLFFIADDVPNGIWSDYKLWKSDGTAAGTVAIKNAWGADVTMEPTIYQPVAVMNGVYYFNRGELWRSDGTAAGTYRVKDIQPNGSANPESLVVASGKLFFRADDGVHGTELWKSDGTSAGTVIVKDITPGPDFTVTGNFYSNGTTVFFGAADANGGELWKSDGTAAGTVMVKNINLTSTVNSNPQNYAMLNGILYFIADDGLHGYELWRSNGTAAGTFLVKNINLPLVGPDNLLYGSSFPGKFREIEGRLYFSAKRFSAGRELWVTDGTTAGTVMVKDINPNGDSSPTQLEVVANKLLFFADDGEHGREVFSYGNCSSSASTTSLRMAAEETSEPVGIQLKILENPVRHTIIAEVRGIEDQPVSFYLTDLAGRQLQNRTITTAEASERQVFDVKSQASGTLLLRAVSGHQSQTIRIVKTE